MLFPHQIQGALWLANHQRGYLGDKPGLGKTRTVLHALDIGPAVGDTLVVCPAAVRSHWRAEDRVLSGRNSNRESLHVKSYDEITRGGVGLMKELIGRQGVNNLVLDEAHYLKHAKSQRCQTLLGRDGYARRMHRVICASGTPVPRHPGEFWTILSTLFPAVALAHGLKTAEDFDARFCIKRGSFMRGAWREKVVGMQNDAEFREILDAVMLRREVAGPALWWQPWSLDAPDFHDDDLTPHELRAYKGKLEDWAREKHVARYRRLVGEAKVEPVVALLVNELDESEDKIVIFAHHRSVLRRLYERLSACVGAVIVDGSTSDSQRDFRKQCFINEPTCRVFIGQNDACGIGMDGLQYAASRLVLVEPNWVATTNEQYGKRLARTGQQSQVIAQMVCLAGTLDEWIVRQNVREVQMQDRMFGETIL